MFYYLWELPTWVQDRVRSMKPDDHVVLNGIEIVCWGHEFCLMSGSVSDLLKEKK